ncbi:MAG: Gfo/Idh/MocA family oxidoreductase [Victivallales bacterium]
MSKTIDKIIRVGIAGQGRSGYGIHANWLKRSGDLFQITAVADQLQERRDDAQKEFGAKAYSDWRELLKAGGFDLFINALPSPLHVPATIEALEAGYHVVCEKPMAANVKDFDLMVATAKKNGKMLAPFQNNRFQPFFQKILEIVRSGVLGEIIYVRSSWGSYARRWDWQTIQCNMGGTLFNTGPHALDQALMLFGEKETPSVFCRMSCHNEMGGDSDDICAVTLSGKQSPQVEVLISGYLAYPQGDMYSISGTRGGLKGNPNSLTWKYYDKAQAPEQDFWKTWSEKRKYTSETLPWIENHWEVPAEIAQGNKSGYTIPSYEIAVKTFYDNIASALRDGSELLITIPQVRRQIAVIEECHRQNPLPRKYKEWVPGKGGVEV